MIDNDDMLHRVDRHYLGPTGFTLPFRVRYGAVGIGFVIPVAIFIIARAIVHVPINFQSIVIILALGVVLTSKVTKYVNADRPLRSVLKAAWNDLNAPRPPKGTVTLLKSANWENRWGEHRTTVVQRPQIPGRDHQPLRVVVLPVSAQLP
ncbi:hypothetical protein NXT08_23645 (plasmid) [Rhodococcus pyridinivorans]|uniref:hypothetical protein n=2 Tax=Nocardiaceae TaxID=85025 RepID=UPI001C5760E7|nr:MULTISPECIES: hypothetical protein [Rhodococcus]QXU56346.1 hypothetical protein KXC42_24415 [Rhodococcus sp. LW-XY12]UQB75725.1 hypothetical protein KI427_26125 [Rhodococcus ruber]UVT27555.1 hypothetical protein NXT08_23645 [Rhodococcus pyridinivorans]